MAKGLSLFALAVVAVTLPGYASGDWSAAASPALRVDRDTIGLPVLASSLPVLVCLMLELTPW